MGVAAKRGKAELVFCESSADLEGKQGSSQSRNPAATTPLAAVLSTRASSLIFSHTQSHFHTRYEKTCKRR